MKRTFPLEIFHAERIPLLRYSIFSVPTDWNGMALVPFRPIALSNIFYFSWIFKCTLASSTSSNAHANLLTNLISALPPFGLTWTISGISNQKVWPNGKLPGTQIVTSLTLTNKTLLLSDEPVITHGLTLTSKIRFRDVVQVIRVSHSFNFVCHPYIIHTSILRCSPRGFSATCLPVRLIRSAAHSI